MKVTFVNPPQTASKYKFMGVVAPPLGLTYMAAVLEENDVEVNIIDASALEMSWHELKEELRISNPDIVAITALTPTITQALKSAKLGRNICPQALVVMGGYHPSFNYHEILQNDYVDVVICGEGEYTILELVKTLESGGDLSEVKGIAYGDIITPPRPLISDLDELPLPARHLLPLENYTFLNLKTSMTTMITSSRMSYAVFFLCIGSFTWI